MRLKIDIQSRWHVGSGYGDGPGADALVVRTKEGLPYVPGKTLKGLLRDACRLAEDLGHLATDTTDRLFGAVTDKSKQQDKPASGTERFLTRSGSLHIGSARMGATSTLQEQWRQWAQERSDARDILFHTIHATALTSEGVIKQETLRAFEFVIPMALYADIEGTEADLQDLQRCFPLVRELGVRRNRGFGRCALTVAEPPQ